MVGVPIPPPAFYGFHYAHGAALVCASFDLAHIGAPFGAALPQSSAGPFVPHPPPRPNLRRALRNSVALPPPHSAREPARLSLGVSP